MLFSVKYFIFYFILLQICDTGGFFQSNDKSKISDSGRQCFCELKGSIDDCTCTVDTVDHYNNIKIFPRLSSLLIKDYFRFYKVNLYSDCPFWADDSKCAMKFCHVQPCEDKDIPFGLKGAAKYSFNEKPAKKYSEDNQQVDCNKDLDVELGYLNTSISDKAALEFQKWAEYDEALDNFCILDDNQEHAEYVDLLLNPERYTGYKGESAHRIWSNIYQENCFLPEKQRKSRRLKSYHDLQAKSDMCMEQRVFYRLISGLHTSINIHLSAHYLLSEKKDFVSPNGIWGLNLDEFIRRFSPETTNNEGGSWLRNLYFIYLVELRAIAKAAPYLRNELYYTGNLQEDEDVQVAVNELLNVVESFPSHFNESQMFLDGAVSAKLKNEFREKFRNISRIMDCVGCDKCKLWGKLQTQGLGTALKILFSGKFDLTHNKVPVAGSSASISSEETFEVLDITQLKLKRTEIVALFNAFGRLSNSIRLLEDIRKELR